VSVLTDRQNVRRQLPYFAIDHKLETIGQQRAQHQAKFVL